MEELIAEVHLMSLDLGNSRERYLRGWREDYRPDEDFNTWLKRCYPATWRRYAVAKVLKERLHPSIDKENQMYDEMPRSGTLRAQLETTAEDSAAKILLLKSFGLDNYEVGDVLRVTKVYGQIEQTEADMYDEYYSANKSADAKDKRPRRIFLAAKIGTGWKVMNDKNDRDQSPRTWYYRHWGQLVENFFVQNDGEVETVELATEWTVIPPITDGRRLRNM